MTYSELVRFIFFVHFKTTKDYNLLKYQFNVETMLPLILLLF